MFWLILGMIVLALVGFGLIYHQWRQDNPEKARRMDKVVQRAASKAAASASSLAHAAASTAAHAVKSGVEAMATPKDPLRWLGPDDVLQVGRLRIGRPLTYLSIPRAGCVFEPSAIDPSLPIRAAAASQTQGLPYWPRYDQMIPAQRYLYLQWLICGRRSMPHEIGYAFVFVYGLERRALIDQQDIGLVIAELLRLREMHAARGTAFSGSFENYTSSFLWFLTAASPSSFDRDLIRRLMTSTRYWNEEKIGAALAWWAGCGEPLADWAAFMIAGESPQSQRSVVTRRVGEEFLRLFSKRYNEQFDGGIVLKQSDQPRKHSYVTASAAIGTCTCESASPLGLGKHLRGLSRIWNLCIEDLRKLSSVVTKEGHGELTAAAWEAMPLDLRAGVDHPLTDQFCQLVNDHTDERGRTLLPVSKLTPLVDENARDRLTPAQGRRLCQTIEHVGYGLEPDARLTGKGYKGDDKVAAFLRVSNEATEPSRYTAALCMLRLGMMVAAVDGRVDEDELALITQEIEKWFHLNDEEQRRLEAMRSLLEVQGADLTGLSALVKGLRPDQRQAIGRMLIALAACDGVVTKDEIRAVRKCYKALGISEAEVDDAIRAIESKGGDDLVTVQKGKTAAPGEAIPPVATKADGLHLDRCAIAAIMQESREVATLLAEAMNVHQGMSEASTASSDVPVRAATIAAAPVATLSEAAIGATVISSADPTVPERYAAFYQLLITRGEWTMEEVQALARQHGIMLGGAVEALNDWSFEKFGGQLFVEDGSNLFVEKSLLN